jgi:hypothetical protein
LPTSRAVAMQNFMHKRKQSRQPKAIDHQRIVSPPTRTSQLQPLLPRQQTIDTFSASSSYKRAPSLDKQQRSAATVHHSITQPPLTLQSQRSSVQRETVADRPQTRRNNGGISMISLKRINKTKVFPPGFFTTT